MASKVQNFDPEYAKYVASSVVVILLVLAMLVGGPKLALKLRSERTFAEQALLASDVVKRDFAFIYGVTAVENPARGRRGFGQHAWSVRDGSGYFTFDVRGYKQLKSDRLDTMTYRVHFTRDLDTSRVTRIEENPPWIEYGQEPNQSPQHNAGSRPSSGDSSASETTSSVGPRG